MATAPKAPAVAAPPKPANGPEAPAPRAANPLHSQVLNHLAKSAIPVIASSINSLHMGGLVRYAELGSAMLQGKGAGSGWDLGAEVRAASRCIARPDPVLLDIGANFGQWSAAMARLFPGTRKIILFEPQPDCIAFLSSLTLPGKVVLAGGAGERRGTHSFFIGEPGWQAASFYQRNETFFTKVQQREVTVPVFTIDDVIDEQGIEFVDFAKLDIEGAELLALKGASRALSRRSIGALSFEFGSGNINSRTFFRDFWDLLTGYGMEILRVLPSGVMVGVPGYYEDLEYFRGVSNYVARLPGGARAGRSS